jgi:hypothetical protein
MLTNFFMKKNFVGLILCGIVCCHAHDAAAQRVAVSANVVDWAILSPGAAVDVRLNRRLTLELSLAGNPYRFTIAGYQYSLFRFTPQLKYWFNRPMARHYCSLVLNGTWFDVNHNNMYNKGDMGAVGFSYGYAMELARHWNMELSIGAGIGRLRNFNYANPEEIPDEPNDLRWIPVPMNVGVKFAYIFD